MDDRIGFENGPPTLGAELTPQEKMVDTATLKAMDFSKGGSSLKKASGLDTSLYKLDGIL